jgi:DNA-binding CsgD family transcriptional regulator
MVRSNETEITSLRDASVQATAVSKAMKSLAPSTDVVYGLAHLPGIPTRAWCRKAAKQLAGAFPHDAVLVALVDVSPTGAAHRTHCAGLIDAGKDVARSEGEGVHPVLSAPGWDTGSTAAAQGAKIVPGKSGVGICAAGFAAPGGVAVCVMPVGGGSTSSVVYQIALRSTPASPDTTEAMLHMFASIAGKLAHRAFGGGTEIRWITEREQEVVDLLCMGHSVPEISKKLKRSIHTIHDHIKKIHYKLGINNRGELVGRALGVITSSGSNGRSNARA